MLKRLLFFVSGVIVFIMSGNTCLAIPVVSCCADSTIILTPIPIIGNPTPPKAPVVVPISASYESMISSLILTFSYNLNDIVVEVTNTTSCGYASIIVDTQYLSAIIPLSFGAGHYIILFTLPSGQQYQGEFDR